MGANKGNKNLDAGVIADLVSMGHTVTVNADGGFVVSPANANEAKPKANKPAAKKTTPAKPKREVPIAVRRTWDNRAAFKAMKGKELPAKLHGKTTYTQKEAIAAGLLTPVTRKPTAQAGKTNKTATETVELTPESLAYLKANHPELLV